MKLYNKGGRAIIIAATDVISGGRISEHDIKKDRVYFDPSSDIEVKDVCGAKLLGMYPAMIMRMDKPRVKSATAKPKAKKAIAKKPAKVG